MRGFYPPVTPAATDASCCDSATRCDTPWRAARQARRAVTCPLLRGTFYRATPHPPHFGNGGLFFVIVVFLLFIPLKKGELKGDLFISNNKMISPAIIILYIYSY